MGFSSNRNNPLPILLVGALLFSFELMRLEPQTVARPDADRRDSKVAQEARARMVQEQIVARGVKDQHVLEAMSAVPRQLFVPPALEPLAYADSPLPIGHGQTISQPYIVAFMSEAAEVKPQDRVLEIGTGSGYQAAVLAHLAREVYSIEIVTPLAQEAAARLERLGYSSLHLRVGDGYRGWPEAAPFDAILVTAAPERIPRALVNQLAMGGRMVVPLGNLDQVLVRIRKTPSGLKRENLLPVRFVPMISSDGSSPVQNHDRPR